MTGFGDKLSQGRTGYEEVASDEWRGERQTHRRELFAVVVPVFKSSRDPSPPVAKNATGFGMTRRQAGQKRRRAAALQRKMCSYKAMPDGEGRERV